MKIAEIKKKLAKLEENEPHALVEAKELINALRELKNFIAPLPELEDKFPVVLYLESEEDREGLIQEIMRVQPNMKTRKLHP